VNDLEFSVAGFSKSGKLLKLLVLSTEDLRKNLTWSIYESKYEENFEKN
jgi:hypothetical protein